HPWVQVDGVAPEKPLDDAVIAESMSKEEIAGLKRMLDDRYSGQITFEELKAELKRVGANLKESEIYDLILCHIIQNFARFDLGALKYLDIDGELVERSHKMNDLNRGEILQVHIIPDVNVGIPFHVLSTFHHLRYLTIRKCADV
ncbi:calcium-dependent protein kinase 1-like protein, partial [Tanacetum coccineum]